MDDDFTFPTVAAPAEEQQDLGELPGQLPGAASPLWPFTSSSSIRTTSVTAPPPRTIGRPVLQHDEEDRMDLLWEDFNDVDLRAGAWDRHHVWPPWSGSSASSAESGETSPREYGCAPRMLRVSSRAGEFYYSNRPGRRTTGWNLLLRLFQRLFAIEKAPPSQSRRHGIHVR